MSVRVITGDCRDVLKTLDADSFDCIVTSPPYWGLRDYGTATWEGGDPDCDHIAVDTDRTAWANSVKGPNSGGKNGTKYSCATKEVGGRCGKCGAFRVDSQIGLEPTLDAYVETMVGVARELKRALKPQGTFWLNIGDCYAGSWGAQSREHGGKHAPNISALSANQVKAAQIRTGTGSLSRTGLKPKDLCMIPHRLAIALQDDGWWVRGDQVWAKSNGMPESTRDRPSRAHEYVFLLTKSEQYYFGYDDVKLPPVPDSVSRLARAMRASVDGGEAGFVVSGGGYAPPGQAPHQGARKTDKQRGHGRRHAGFNDRWDAMERAEQQSQGSALRSVWWIAPTGYAGTHFAAMPVELAAVCILAGCPHGGSVLDPFGGAGTTGLVADRLGRNATLIELNPAYREMGENRVRDDAPLFWQAAE